MFLNNKNTKAAQKLTNLDIKYIEKLHVISLIYLLTL